MLAMAARNLEAHAVAGLLELATNALEKEFGEDSGS
jgi:hypothetical protein